MIKLIRLVLLAAVVLGATVLMALPKGDAAPTTASAPNATAPGSTDQNTPSSSSNNSNTPAGPPSGAHAPGGGTVVPVETGGPALTDTEPILPQPEQIPGTTVLPAPPVGPTVPVTPASGTARTVWPKNHVIQSGETFQKIAKRYYGGFSKWRRIADANPGVDPTRIRPGQKLVIPAPARTR